VEPLSSTNFAIKFYLNEKDAEILIERFKNKYPLVKGTKIFRVETRPGEEEKKLSFESIIASYSFN